MRAAADPSAPAAAIRHHYDVGNDFWRLWLDPTMTYSGALWASGDTLAGAQLRKLDLLVEGAGAVVSAGAIEHFARPGTTRAAKVAGYRDCLTRWRDWLEPGGRVALQTIVQGDARPTLASLEDT